MNKALFFGMCIAGGVAAGLGLAGPAPSSPAVAKAAIKAGVVAEYDVVINDFRPRETRSLYRVRLPDGPECILATFDLTVDAISCNWEAK